MTKKTQGPTFYWASLCNVLMLVTGAVCLATSDVTYTVQQRTQKYFSTHLRLGDHAHHISVSQSLSTAVGWTNVVIM